MNANNGSGTVVSRDPSMALTSSGSGIQLRRRIPEGLEQALAALQQGVAGAIPDGTAVLVAGSNLTKQSILDQLGALLNGYQALAELRAQIAEKRGELSQSLVGGQVFARHLKDGLIAYFGRGNSQLAKFGIATGKSARQLTVQEKAARVARARATRALRHTLGSRQRAALRSPPVTVVLTATPANDTGPSADGPPPAAKTG